MAQAFSTRFPDRVQALGLIASTPKFVANDSWPGIQPQVLASFSKQLATDHSALIEKFMAIQAMGSATAKQDIKQIKQWVLAAPAPDFTALSAGLDMLLNVDLRDNFANLAVTTRLILGKLDSLVPAKVIPQLQALNTKIAVHQVAKASHAPFVSHPDDFIEWLSDLVK